MNPKYKEVLNAVLEFGFVPNSAEDGTYHLGGSYIIYIGDNTISLKAYDYQDREWGTELYYPNGDGYQEFLRHFYQYASEHFKKENKFLIKFEEYYSQNSSW